MAARLMRAGGVIAAAAASACSPLTAVDLITPPTGYDVERDIAYGDTSRQRLDLYMPSRGGTEPPPLVAFFYGGRWSEGERRGYRFVGQALASRGIATAIVDYRLYPDVRFPDFVEDGARAVTWLQREGDGRGFDPERVFLMGHSAGAHIGAMLSTDDRYLERAGSSVDSLAGFIGLAGPYDFLPIKDADLIDIFGAVEEHPVSQPVNFVSGNEPPMLLLHGSEDRSVWPVNSKRLAARVNDTGGTAELVVYDGVDHVRIVGALAGNLRFLAPVLADVVRFVASTP